MRLAKDNRGYRLSSTYDERAIPKAAGFRWNPTQKQWWTDDPDKALRVAAVAELGAGVEEALNSAQARRAANLTASAATSSDIDIPCPAGLAYLPFQRAGIAFALDRPATLIGDEMGLGKTIQTVGVMNATRPRRTLVICPASLKINWARELKRWLVHDLAIHVAPKDPVAIGEGVLVINYDILEKHMPELAAARWDLVVVDEAHYIKNPKAQRTANVLALAALGQRKLFLTGTPILNRPVELFPMANALDPVTFPKFFPFAMRYCAAAKSQWGWDFSGASNLGELQEKLRRSIMVRRLKADVLTELPPKRRQIIPLPVNGYAAIMRAEARAEEVNADEIEEAGMHRDLARVTDNDDAYRDAVKRLRDLTRVRFDEMSRVRHLTALAKVEAVADHVRAALEANDKVVVFAHHRDVIRALMLALADYHPVSLTGEDTQQDRQAAVDAFQSNASTRVFIGSTLAAGLGLTLTAASTVVFAELDWVPGNMTQAEDRLHRIGQHDAVLVQHLVIDGSIDARMVHVIVGKQAVIDRALDGQVPDGQAEAPAVRKRPPAPQVDAQAIPDVHEALRILAEFDPDHAAELNGVGFNRYDGAFGHDLAELDALTPRQAAVGLRLVTKYRRQLPTELRVALGLSS